MAGYQPGGGRGGERPGPDGGAPEGPGSRGARRGGPPARRDGPPAPRPQGAGRRGTGYPESGYRDAGHREPGHREPGFREPGFRESGYRDGGNRGGDYREAGYRAADYPDAGYGYQGYRDDRPGDGSGQDYRADRYAGRRGPGRDQYGDGRDALDAGRERGHGRQRDTTGGADGNERLTALTGVLLLGLLAAEGFTILAVRQLMTLHFFIGMLLVGPVLLKAGSTGYRFTRYYTGTPDYRRKGPPAPLLRLLGPFVVLLSVAVIGSGIMLAVTGPAGQLWIFAHKASFVLWFGAMSIHVLAYIWRLPRLVTGELAARTGARAWQVLAGRPARWLLLAGSLLLGLVLALLTYHTAGAWAGFSGGG